MEQTQAPKAKKLGKWEGWKTHFEKVPVQYGNLSKHERRVVHLALIGSMPSQGRVQSYYRIADGERGAGRIFVMRRWKDIDEQDGVEKIWTQRYYLRYRDLPEEIRKHIDSGATKTYYSALPDEETEPDLDEHDDGTTDPNPETLDRESREAR